MEDNLAATTQAGVEDLLGMPWSAAMSVLCVEVKVARNIPGNPWRQKPDFVSELTAIIPLNGCPCPGKSPHQLHDLVAHCLGLSNAWALETCHCRVRLVMRLAPAATTAGGRADDGKWRYLPSITTLTMSHLHQDACLISPYLSDVRYFLPLWMHAEARHENRHPTAPLSHLAKLMHVKARIVFSHEEPSYIIIKKGYAKFSVKDRLILLGLFIIRKKLPKWSWLAAYKAMLQACDKYEVKFETARLKIEEAERRKAVVAARRRVKKAKRDKIETEMWRSTVAAARRRAMRVDRLAKQGVGKKPETARSTTRNGFLRRGRQLRFGH